MSTMNMQENKHYGYHAFNIHRIHFFLQVVKSLKIFKKHYLKGIVTEREEKHGDIFHPLHHLQGVGLKVEQPGVKQASFNLLHQNVSPNSLKSGHYNLDLINTFKY